MSELWIVKSWDYISCQLRIVFALFHSMVTGSCCVHLKKKIYNNNGTQRWHPASLQEPWSTGPCWGCSFLPKEEFPVSAFSSYHIRKYLVRFSPVALLRVWGLFAKPCSWLLLLWYKSKWTAHNFSSKFVIQPFIACHDLQCKVAVQNPKKPLLLCEGCCSLRS